MTGQPDKRQWVAAALAALAVPGILLAANAASAQGAGAPLAAGALFTYEPVLPRGPFHGIHGLTFDGQNRLLAGSVVGQTLYHVDPESGAVAVEVGPPEGMADDVEESADGLLAWTAFLDGIVYVRAPGAEPQVAARGLPGINSLAFAPDGRLFATQVFLGDALYEIDTTGVSPPRLIMEGMGGLNGFDFGPDGHLYGPLWFKGQVVRVDVDAATLEVVAGGFDTPAAANFDSGGNLYVVDTARGEVVRVDTDTGAQQVVARVRPAIDNLALDRDDRLFLTNMADNAIIEVDPQTGDSRTVVWSPLAVAGDIAAGDGGLYVADLFALRHVTPEGPQGPRVRELARVFGGEIDYPLHVSLAHDGRLVVTGWSAGAVQVLDPESGDSEALLHGFTTPHDALLLPGGDLLVAEFVPGVLVWSAGPDWKDRTVAVEGLAGPAALLMGGPGEIYVSEALAGRIVQVDIRTGAKTVVAQGLDLPEGMDWLDDGRIVVAEAGAARLTAVDVETGELEVLADDLPFGGLVSSPAAPEGSVPTFMPTGVAVLDGVIYFTSDTHATLYRLLPPAAGGLTPATARTRGNRPPRGG